MKIPMRRISDGARGYLVTGTFTPELLEDEAGKAAVRQGIEADIADAGGQRVGEWPENLKERNHKETD